MGELLEWNLSSQLVSDPQAQRGTCLPLGEKQCFILLPLDFLRFEHETQSSPNRVHLKAWLSKPIKFVSPTPAINSLSLSMFPYYIYGNIGSKAPLTISSPLNCHMFDTYHFSMFWQLHLCIKKGDRGRR